MAELLVFSVWKVDRFVPQLPLNISSQIFGGFRHYISEKSGVAGNDFYNGISHQLRVHSIVVRTKNLIEEICAVSLYKKFRFQNASFTVILGRPVGLIVDFRLLRNVLLYFHSTSKKIKQ